MDALLRLILPCVVVFLNLQARFTNKLPLRSTLSFLFVQVRSRRMEIIMIDLKGKPFYLNDRDIAWVDRTLAGMTEEENSANSFLT